MNHSPRLISLVLGCLPCVVAAEMVTIDPDSYGDRANLTDTLGGVDLRVANDKNVPSDFFKVTANGLTLKTPPTGIHVFGQSNVAFWPSSMRFYARFPNQTDEVSLKFTGGSGINPERGIMQAYNASGLLVGEYLTAPVLHGTVETMTISRPTADISHIIAYTPSEYGSFGILDCLQYNSVTRSPEISVSAAGGSELVDGSGLVDFGKVASGAVAKKSFTIRNVGTSDLTNLGLRLTGTHAVDFSASSLSATTLAPGASATVTITFSTELLATRSATLQILSNDEDENPFDISLQGEGFEAPAPEIEVHQGTGFAKNLYSGLSRRDFGRVRLGKSSIAMAFVIKNTGTARLRNLKVTFVGQQEAEFRLIKAPATSLAPGASSTFKVIYTPKTTKGSRTTLRIANNDDDENPFRVPLTGKGFR